MLSTLLKIIAAVGVVFLAYKAASIYALLQFADHMRECMPASGVCRLAERKAPREQIEAAMEEALSCARRKQSRIEALLFVIPKSDAPGTSTSSDDKALAEMCNDWGRTP